MGSTYWGLDENLFSDDEGDRETDGRTLYEQEQDYRIWLEQESADRAAALAEEPQSFAYDGFSEEAREYHRGAESYSGQDDGPIELVYNASDNLQLEKGMAELEQIKLNVTAEVSVDDIDKITPLESFAACMPPGLMKLFANWTGVRDADKLVNYLRVETLMRFYNCSAKMLFACQGFNSGGCGELSYNEVRSAMREADKPMPERTPPPNSVAGEYNPAFSVPPEITKLEQLCSEHWSGLFFVLRVTWCDLDDDKIPNQSNLFDLYGIKRIPTSDKKLKPFVHLLASVASGLILGGEFEKLEGSVASIVMHLILRLFDARYPDEVNRSDSEKLCMFIDRGYVSLAKNTEEAITLHC